jgi:hypothetical protein
MQEHHERIEIETLADAEITRAIRYLDPDLRAEQNEEGTSTVVGIGVIFLTALTDALTSISLYIRDL